MDRAEENASQALYSTRRESGNNSWQRLWLPAQKCERQCRKWVCGKLHSSQRGLPDIDERIGWCFMKYSWSSSGDLSGKSDDSFRVSATSVCLREKQEAEGKWEDNKGETEFRTITASKVKLPSERERDLKLLRSIWRQLTTDLSHLESRARTDLFVKLKAEALCVLKTCRFVFVRNDPTREYWETLRQGQTKFLLINQPFNFELEIKTRKSPRSIWWLGIQTCCLLSQPWGQTSIPEPHEHFHHLAFPMTEDFPRDPGQKSFFAGQFQEKKNAVFVRTVQRTWIGSW